MNWHVLAARAADDKLASNTIVLDVGDVVGITDHFIITSGSSRRQVRAIAEGIEADLKLVGGPCLNVLKVSVRQSGSCWTSAYLLSTFLVRKLAVISISNGCGRTAIVSSGSKPTEIKAVLAYKCRYC